MLKLDESFLTFFLFFFLYFFFYIFSLTFVFCCYFFTSLIQLLIFLLFSFFISSSFFFWHSLSILSCFSCFLNNPSSIINALTHHYKPPSFLFLFFSSRDSVIVLGKDVVQFAADLYHQVCRGPPEIDLFLFIFIFCSLWMDAFVHHTCSNLCLYVQGLYL